MHITQFVCDDAGLELTGRIKSCAEDFTVIELDPTERPVCLSGSLAHINPAPRDARQEARRAPSRAEHGASDDGAQGGGPAEVVNVLDCVQRLACTAPACLLAALGPEAAASLWAWVCAHLGLRSGETPPVQVAPPTLSKPERARVHCAVQRCLPALRTSVREGAIVAAPHASLGALRALLGDARAHSVLAFEVRLLARAAAGAQAGAPNGTAGAAETLRVLEPDREKRGALHGLLRRHFPALSAQTIHAAHGGGAGIELRAADARGRKRARSEDSASDAAGGARCAPNGEYLHVVVEKTNVEWHCARTLISRAFRARPCALSWAGTKDKYALTRQRVSVRGARGGAELRRAAAELEPLGIRLGSPAWAHRPVSLGSLRGNDFVIVVRRVRAAREGAGDTEAAVRDTLAARLESVRTTGFVNYFGLQRFGRIAACQSHDVGVLLLRKEWAAAVDLLVGSSRGALETPAVGRVRAVWRNAVAAIGRTRIQGDEAAAARMVAARDTLRAMGALARADADRLATERALLRPLEQHGECKLALTALGHGKEGMYVEAYLSLLWNELASLRIELLGCRGAAVPGELVLRRRAAGAAPAGAEPEAEGGALGSASAQHAADVEPWQLTAAGEDGAGSAPQLCDIVLALPGKHATYAPPALAQLYTRRLAADGLEPASLPSSIRFRQLVVRPPFLSATWLAPALGEGAQDAGDPPHFPPRALPASAPAADACDLASAVVSREDSPAVRLCFRLPPAAYATMLLREVLRHPSDALEAWAADARDESRAEAAGTDEEKGCED